MHQNKNQNNQSHIPVLLTEVLEYLAPERGDAYLDLTAGYGGHADAILERTGSPGRMTLVDRDPRAIDVLQQHYASKGVEIRQADFLSASQQLVREGRQYDCILADIGVSSPHLNEVRRGFSIQLEGPLDMRMDQTQALTAEEIVNTWSADDLAKILADYGEEPKARRIAQLILEHRPFRTTSELATVVAKAWPGHSRVHPATRTFQALRIAVNDELGQLEQSLPLWQQLLAPGGRMGVISFHSLEDRIVKRFMSEQAGERYDAELRSVTKRPVVATSQELVFNPRSRSAKLRVAAKINNKTERS